MIWACPTSTANENAVGHLKPGSLNNTFLKKVLDLGFTQTTETSRRRGKNILLIFLVNRPSPVNKKHIPFPGLCDPEMENIENLLSHGTI